MGTDRIEMNAYRDTIAAVRKLLRDNPEWIARYKHYIDTLAEKKAAGTFSRAQQQFAVPAPFQLYLSLSMAIHKCTAKRTAFELRFHGQSVATVFVDYQKEKAVLLQVKKVPAIYKVLREKSEADIAYMDSLEPSALYDWHGEEARNFRRIYASLERTLTSTGDFDLLGQPEHDMESFLLANYAKKRSDEKEISYIQPVTMLDTSARFQMPTPIKASSVKDGIDTLSYAGKSGGGIDILARVGSGRSTTLAVMELKDENKDSEPPHKVICQAIAYAAFLRELLRSESGDSWWSFFGFGGSVPKRLTLKAIVVMPLKNQNGTVSRQTEAFMQELRIPENTRLLIPNSEDQIKLGYVFRNDGAAPEKSF